MTPGQTLVGVLSKTALDIFQTVMPLGVAADIELRRGSQPSETQEPSSVTSTRRTQRGTRQFPRRLTVQGKVARTIVLRLC